MYFWQHFTSPVDFTDNILAFLAFLGFATFVVIYAKFSNWRATQAGESLMFAVASAGLVLLLNTIHLFTGPYPGIEWVRLPVYLLLAWSSWRLVRVLITIIRNGGDINLATFLAPHTEKPKKEKSQMFVKVQTYAKFIVSMLGALLSAGSLLIPAQWGQYITLAIVLLTAFAVYKVPNTTTAQVVNTPITVPVDTTPAK